MTGPHDPSIALNAELLLAHSAWLKNLARALVVSDDEIDDVVQQTYLQALTKPPRHTDNLRAWLAAIARNIVRSRSRSDTSRVSRELAVAPPTAIEDPAEAIERAELRQRVVEAVLALDEPYRSSLILRFFEEMEVDAIGKMMGSGADTVRTRVRRGVIRVREQLERQIRDKSRDAEDGGAAALALTFARLRRIAEGGSGGNVVPARPATALAQHRRPAAITTRGIYVGAAASLVVLSSWWWTRDRSDARKPAVDAAPRGVDEPVRSPDLNRAAAAVPERSADRTAPPPADTAPEPSPPSRFAKRATIRGLVTDAVGNPVPRAQVWAIPSPDYRYSYKMPDFEWSLSDHSRLRPGVHTVGDWVEATCDDGGRFEITGLSPLPGWSVGAYEPRVGAMVRGLVAFDQSHVDARADLQLMPGRFVRGVILDETGEPIGNAHVRLFLHGPTSDLVARAATTPSGTSAGEFDFGFRCGEQIDIECDVPGFVDLPRTRVEIVAHSEAQPLKYTLERKPGDLVQGRIVDSKGSAFDLESLLVRMFPASKPGGRAARARVFATPSDTTSSDVGQPTAHKPYEGRVNFALGRYEVVVPAGFGGTLELRIDETRLGTALLPDSKSSPDLVCDERSIPAARPTVEITARFVDEESKQPIDLEHEDILPIASNEEKFFQVVKDKCDLRRGLVCYECEPGFLRIDESLDGYVTTARFTTCPQTSPRDETTIEIPRANALIRGTLHHADGSAYPKCPLLFFRRVSPGKAEQSGFPVATNNDGDFESMALAKGDYFVVVNGADGESTAVRPVVASDPPQEFDVRMTVGVPTRFRIVTDRPVKNPPPRHFMIIDANGVMVESLNRDPALESAPDEFSATIDAGHYHVIVERAGYQRAIVEFDVPTNGSIEIPLHELKPGQK